MSDIVVYIYMVVPLRHAELAATIDVAFQGGLGFIPARKGTLPPLSWGTPDKVLPLLL